MCCIEVKPVRSFLDLACYVSMFPQLVAGPIVRYRDVSEQLRDRTHTLAKFAAGGVLFAIGMAKKVLVADNVAPIADRRSPIVVVGRRGLLSRYSVVVLLSLPPSAEVRVKSDADTSRIATTTSA